MSGSVPNAFVVRSMALTGVLVLSCAGCDVVFGLEREPTEVEVEFTRRHVVNTAAGLPEIVDDVPAYAPEALLLDGSSVPIVDRGQGRFTLQVPREARYRLRFTNSVGVDIEHQSVLPRLQIVEFILGRLDDQPVTPGTAVTLGVSPPTIGTIALVTTGVWSETSHVFALGETWRLEWSAAELLRTGAFALDSARGDRAYCVRRAVDQGRRVLVDAFGTMMLDIEDGQANPVTCPLQPAAANECIDVEARRADVAASLMLNYPGLGLTEFSTVTRIHSAPITGVQSILGHLLGFETNGDPAIPTDHIEQFMYANPYPGQVPLVSESVSYQRLLEFGGGTPRYHGVSVVRWVRPLPCPAKTVLTPSAGLLGAVSLNGVLLDRDDLVITGGASTAEISWRIIDGKPIDLFSVRLKELVVVNGATEIVSRLVYVTTDPHVTIDASLLEPGRRYFVTVLAIQGIPGASRGDLRLDELAPGEGFGLTSVDTPTFGVE